MNAKEKAIKYLNTKKWWFPLETLTEPNKEVKIFNHALDIAIKEAKKEVFDVFDKYACIKDDKWYKDLKKRHLSTFQKRKAT